MSGDRFVDLSQGRFQNASCKRVQAQFFDYLDGELALAERLAVEAHLEACVFCRHELTQRRSAERALASALSEVPAAGDLRPAFYARLAAEPAPRSRWAGWRIAVPTLAACGLALAFLRLAPPNHPTHLAETPSESRSTTPALAFRSAPPLETIPLEPRARTDRELPSVGLRARRPDAYLTSPGEQRVAMAEVTRLHENRFPMLQVTEDAKKAEASFYRHAAESASTHKGAILSEGLSNTPLQNLPAPVTLQIASTKDLATASDFKETTRFYALDADMADNNVMLKNRSHFDVSPDTKMFGYLSAAARTPGTAFGDTVTMLGMSAKATLGEVSLSVEDDERGFTSNTRMASVSEEREEGEVLTIDAEGAPGTF